MQNFARYGNEKNQYIHDIIRLIFGLSIDRYISFMFNMRSFNELVQVHPRALRDARLQLLHLSPLLLLLQQFNIVVLINQSMSKEALRDFSCLLRILKIMFSAHQIVLKFINYNISSKHVHCIFTNQSYFCFIAVTRCFSIY